jgi:hypothetical protein
MIGVGLRPNTPVDVIAFWWIVNRFIALIPVTETLAAGCLTTAVIIGNDVTLSISRILTGSHPGDW